MAHNFRDLISRLMSGATTAAARVARTDAMLIKPPAGSSRRADPALLTATREAAYREAYSKARQAAFDAARQAEAAAWRDRLAAVFALESSKGRERAAARLLVTKMSVTEIDATLAELPAAEDDLAALVGAHATSPLLHRTGR